jgi:hypothetical protein
MMTFSDLASVPSDPPAPFPDRLRLAVTAYLARFKGSSREHTGSDLRCYLTWCAEHALDPLAVQRAHLELYIRWIQEIRRFNLPPYPGGSRSRPGSTAPAPWMASCSTHPPSTSAGVDLRDVQIAARHADPRTTMRYDRARQNLDRHPNYILAAYMASGT